MEDSTVTFDSVPFAVLTPLGVPKSVAPPFAVERLLILPIKMPDGSLGPVGP